MFRRLWPYVRPDAWAFGVALMLTPAAAVSLWFSRGCSRRPSTTTSCRASRTASVRHRAGLSRCGDRGLRPRGWLCAGSRLGRPAQHRPFAVRDLPQAARTQAELSRSPARGAPADAGNLRCGCPRRGLLVGSHQHHPRSAHDRRDPGGDVLARRPADPGSSAAGAAHARDSRVHPATPAGALPRGAGGAGIGQRVSRGAGRRSRGRPTLR